MEPTPRVAVIPPTDEPLPGVWLSKSEESPDGGNTSRQTISDWSAGVGIVVTAILVGAGVSLWIVVRNL